MRGKFNVVFSKSFEGLWPSGAWGISDDDVTCKRLGIKTDRAVGSLILRNDRISRLNCIVQGEVGKQRSSARTDAS